jgi:hypothetical protein
MECRGIEPWHLVEMRPVRVPASSANLCRKLSFIKKKIQQAATLYQNFIVPYLYEAYHVSGDTPSIIRSLELHWQRLFLYVKGCWTCSRWTSGTVCLTTSTNYSFKQPSTYEEPEAASAVLGS